jgi:flagellar secretion chaperone FliS
MAGDDKTMILIRLYEGAVRFLCEGVDALEAGALDVFGEKLGRAQSVLDELDALVDPSGSVLAADLHDLYAFMARHLYRAGEQQDAAAAREVAGLLQELNHGFPFVVGQADSGATETPGA